MTARPTTTFLPSNGTCPPSLPPSLPPSNPSHPFFFPLPPSLPPSLLPFRSRKIKYFFPSTTSSSFRSTGGREGGREDEDEEDEEEVPTFCLCRCEGEEGEEEEEGEGGAMRPGTASTAGGEGEMR